MDFVASLLAFAGLWAANVALPGPNFVRVSSAAFTGSARLAIVTSFGTATGNAIWCLIAALGAAAITQDPVLAKVLRVAGAGYFAWFAIRLLLSAFAKRDMAGVGGTPANGRAFLDGAATALANPQTAIFFATALSSIFVSLSSVTIVAAILTVVIVTSLWYAIVIALISAPGPRAAYLRIRPALECLFAAVLLLASAKLMASLL
ncbi:lysine exporter (LYSE/YGGA) [Novosphingobium sp. Rr 2-17]|uniref:LysE family translocator n=1 Tax=Novosphingobium sp. Rr 2-17 TaxID=555793 RepID=UPI0002697BEA|nr:LysE family transporter [Novosphingobium sp. Rr 2-17]EIZ77148.1 lysine exporter (LYSE/YGGA) [Novosphingobium sp. Rr 2-17]